MSDSPARRAAAVKTFVRVMRGVDAGRGHDFVVDVFNSIGGARVNAPAESGRRIAGLEIPGMKNDKEEKKKKRLPIDTSFLSKRVVTGEVYKVSEEEKERRKGKKREGAEGLDDGAGGIVMGLSSAQFVKSRFGKMIVGHSVFAALRRIQRMAAREVGVEAFLFDSGLMSVVSSTVRHTMALLELRSGVSPSAVSRYLVTRLPHRNPPAGKRLHLEELGARVYYARLLSSLAEDPNLQAFVPTERKKKAKVQSVSQALDTSNYLKKASNLFKFLFNKERVNEVKGAVRDATGVQVRAKLKRDDPPGIEFAEALIHLLKNASNRVLIEALRGLSRRKWTTWFEAPIPQAALYNSPELLDGEPFGGMADAWGMNEDEEEDEGEDEDELGAYENDGLGEEEGGSKGSLKLHDVPDPDLAAGTPNDEKEGLFSKLNSKRKKRRENRIDTKTPFYLRQVGQGMVPALEVVLRRVYGSLLHDEPVRRFSGADAIIVLARAKVYGHSAGDHDIFRKAKGTIANMRASNSRALVVSHGMNDGLFGGEDYDGDTHPFQALIRPLAEIVEEDPNPYVRGRASVALLFVIASGAGRAVVEPEDLDIQVTPEAFARSARLQSTPLLLRYFRNFVTHEGAGTGVGLKLMSELIDYLIYEVLDIAPDLAPSAVDMAELWAMTHPTIGVCGRLGALWEKTLSIGQAEVVGKSLFRAVASSPRTERIASAAVIFLRRRTLDLSIITVGSSQITGNALPEPLPRAIGVEMEKYFSLLWHAALLGPSAECRTFAVEALGGAAVLAGEPFRCCTYERLVELVRMRGFGLKIPAERVLGCIDVLYFSRERFSEARAENRVARDGSNHSRAWLELVWKLAAEAAAAAQILLGVPPPTGWQPLGPAGAPDLGNAEIRFGDVRDRQDDEKLKDASVAASSAPEEIPLLKYDPEERKVGTGGIGDVPPRIAGSVAPALGGDDVHGSRAASRYADDIDTYSSSGSRRNLYRDNRRSRSRNRSRGRSRSRSRSRSPGSYNAPRTRSDLEYEDEYQDHSPPPRQRRSTAVPSSAKDRAAMQKQEQADFELALKLQQGGSLDDPPRRSSRVRGTSGGTGGDAGPSTKDVAKEMMAGATDMAENLFKRGQKLTQRAMKSAGKAQVKDRMHS